MFFIASNIPHAIKSVLIRRVGGASKTKQQAAEQE